MNEWRLGYRGKHACYIHQMNFLIYQKNVSENKITLLKRKEKIIYIFRPWKNEYIELELEIFEIKQKKNTPTVE